MALKIKSKIFSFNLHLVFNNILLSQDVFFSDFSLRFFFKLSVGHGIC